VLVVSQLTLQQISTSLLLQSMIGFVEQNARAQEPRSPIGQSPIEGRHHLLTHGVSGHRLVGVTRILNETQVQSDCRPLERRSAEAQ
jgi:hypothetical protein